jgi:hypothetical protein
MTVDVRAHVTQRSADRWSRLPRILRGLLVLGLVLAVAALQTHSLWDFRGDRVDESELVHYAVGFLGGDLDPGWYGYGSLGMYLLAAWYALLAVPLLLLGVHSDIGEYAQQLFAETGFFFVSARFLFAAIGVATVLLYASTARRIGVPKFLVAAYVVVAVTATDALFYADYLRSDRLVSFFAAALLCCVVRMPGARGLYAAAVIAAAAGAAKISALPLIGLVIAVAAVRARRGEVTLHAATAAVLLSMVALMVFQPFVDYPERLASLVGRGAAAPFRWSEAVHAGPVDRAFALLRFVLRYVGPALALVPAAMLVRRGRSTLLWASVLLGLLVLPYGLSTELRGYWFLPVYELARFLALLGAWGLLGLARRRWSDRLERPAVRRPAVAGGMLLVLVLAAPGLMDGFRSARTLASTPAANRQLAGSWLEEDVLGRSPIGLDGEFSYLLPRLYDPDDFTTSKLISRAFIYGRWDHPFLNQLFADHLLEVYAPRHGLTGSFPDIEAIRLDLPPGADQRFELLGVGLCPQDGTECLPVRTPVRTNDLELVDQRGSDHEIVTAGGDPHLVLAADLQLPADGSWHLRFQTTTPFDGKVYLDLGSGFSEELTIRFPGSRGIEVPLVTTGLNVPRRVDRVRAATVDERIHRSLGGRYFVTSPAIYGRFMAETGAGLPPERLQYLRATQEGYRQLLSEPLVRRFDEGSGAVIEVYRIGG